MQGVSNHQRPGRPKGSRDKHPRQKKYILQQMFGQTIWNFRAVTSKTSFQEIELSDSNGKDPSSSSVGIPSIPGQHAMNADLASEFTLQVGCGVDFHSQPFKLCNSNVTTEKWECFPQIEADSCIETGSDPFHKDWNFW
jgi:hypothetical protein